MKIRINFLFGAFIGGIVFYLLEHRMETTLPVIEDKYVIGVPSLSTSEQMQLVRAQVELTAATNQLITKDVEDFMNANRLLQQERKAAIRNACFNYKEKYVGNSSCPFKSCSFSLCKAHGCAYPEMTQYQGSEGLMVTKIRKSGLQSSHIKILTVRNPFHRLMAAYLDLLNAHERGDLILAEFSNKIYEEFKHRRKMPAADKISLEDFANFICENQGGVFCDTFDFACEPCSINYDVIIKYETQAEDLKYLEFLTGIKIDNSSTIIKKNLREINYETLREQFRQMPDELAKNVYQHFEIDFESFGYLKPLWLCTKLSRPKY